MDGWKTLNPNSEDWDLIVATLLRGHNVMFPYSNDMATQYQIYIGKVDEQLGIMRWGGRTRGMYLVALRMTGAANVFDLESPQEIFPNYLAEKMGLNDHAADMLALLLNQIRGRLSRRACEVEP